MAESPTAAGGSFLEYVRELGQRRREYGGAADLVVLAQADSTNRLARSIAIDYQNDGIDLLTRILILAYEQSGGRGRHGRQWVSPPGSGVYATLLLPIGDVRQLMSLPLLVGVGLCRALEPYLPQPCRLKWPNDLLVERRDGTLSRRKIGGVLIEALIRAGEPTVAAIGFGVNQRQSAGLPETATSVEAEGGRLGSLAALAWDLVNGLERELSHLGNAAHAIDSYRSLSIHQPGEHLVCEVGNGIVEGTFLGFDDQGLLRLGRPDGELRLAAGEVLNE